jgi:phosphotransferase system  glucose/maltose/N-acetylglucosamine-specific IIC component
MHWTIIAAILVAGTVSSFTDWLFMGVLFADRYKTYPETWWPRATKADETTPIIWSTALGYITAAAVILLCVFAGVDGYKGALIVAALAAAAGPLVISPTNALWVRIDRLVTVAHTLGYIARFLIAGVAAGYVLS